MRNMPTYEGVFREKNKTVQSGNLEILPGIGRPATRQFFGEI